MRPSSSTGLSRAIWRPCCLEQERVAAFAALDDHAAAPAFVEAFNARDDVVLACHGATIYCHASPVARVKVQSNCRSRRRCALRVAG